MTTTMPLVIVIIIPCLNEENNLFQTCQSLGFGSGTEHQEKGIFLCLIDNGSTDNTIEIARYIQRNSASNTVWIGQESERGYVPARHAGVSLVQEIAQSRGWSAESVLVLQADADNLYQKDYIDAMRSVANTHDSNVLLEGYLEYPSDFNTTYAGYVSLCTVADAPLSSLLVNDENDILCSDGVSAYRLSDYQRWGGHIREYNQAGDEIYAETTRMYMRALALGCHKVRVVNAVAHHSQRKLFLDPALEFASAGFPREESWKTMWRSFYKVPHELTEFVTESDHPTMKKALRIRQRHTVALFGILPISIAQVLNQFCDIKLDWEAQSFLDNLPRYSNNQLVSAPAVLLSDILTFVDQ